jgi:hypothetical protein
MKIRWSLAIGLAALVMATGVALAASTGGSRSVSLTPGMAVGYAGLTCTAYAGTTALNANLVCVRNNLAGYGVIVSQAQVIVAKSVKGKIQVFFRKPNE